MNCQDCGAPQPTGAEDCPFCGYAVLFQRVSQLQRRRLVWLFLGLRLLLLLSLVAWLFIAIGLPGAGTCSLRGNIGG